MTADQARTSGPGGTQYDGAREFHGACACGSVRFAVTAELASATPCICPRCRGMGLQSVYALRSTFRLLTGSDALTESMHEARTPHHFFCARCGEAAFGLPQGSNGEVVSVNVSLLERGDPTALLGTSV